jgi:hypothetical protein
VEPVGVEKRWRRPPRRRSRRLARRLADGRTSSSERYDRLYVPRNDPRYLRRNALVALGNVGGRRRARAAATPRRRPLLREHAEWALARLEGARVTTTSASHAERWLAWVRLGAVPVRVVPDRATTGYPPGSSSGLG